MSDSRSSNARARRRKTRLFAGAAACVLITVTLPAQAQTSRATITPVGAGPGRAAVSVSQEPPHAPAPGEHGPVAPDGLTQDQLLVEAEQVVEDQSRHLLTARGSVQARYQGRTLRADEIIYDTESGLVTANGHASIINADGTVQYAEHAELDDKLRAGVATGFSARLQDNGKISAASVVRRSETVNELNRAIFTPCPICDSKGRPHTPTWSIQAEKVIQDHDRQLVYYRHAVIKVGGVPVFYAPVFWHPDPTAKRASGFLIPRVSSSNRRGLSYEQPYLWVISPSQDLTVSPQLNQRVNPFLNVEWRKRFWSSAPTGSDDKGPIGLDARFGYTWERNADGQGRKFGDLTSRSYVLADGRFDITPDWKWGFSAERTSDPTIFDRYDINDVTADRGLFTDERGRLTSQLYTVRQTDRSYLSISTISFQSISAWVNPATGLPYVDPASPGGRDAYRDPACLGSHPASRLSCPLLVAPTGALPLVAPLIEARWDPEQEIAGGRLRLMGSAVILTRDRAETSPGLTPAPGVDSRRATVQGDWRSSFITKGGVRLDPFFDARADVYSISDQVGFPNTSFSRSNVTAGADVSYPLVRHFSNSTVVIEPLLQVAVSPTARLKACGTTGLTGACIPVEDSQSFVFDEGNLFRPDKFTGYDLYEGGARLNAGVRTTVEWGDGYWARAVIGRSFRSSQPYPPGTGFKQRLSDWIVAAETQPITGLTAFARAQIDDLAKVRRDEAGVNWDFSRTHGILRYYKDDNDPFIAGGKAHDVQAAGDFLVTKNWGVVFDATRDLQKRLWRRSELGIMFQDDCTRIEVVYQRNETGILGPSDAVFLRLNLATLGDAGYKRYDDR